MTVLVVMAMAEEAQDVFDAHDVLFTGIGKVNAAYALSKRITETRPSHVVNLGTAGSRRYEGGMVVNPTRFIQRDMDVRALGIELYKTPFSDDPIVLEYGQSVKGFDHGVCGTGDSFDTSAAAENFDVVDMEAYALALICKREDIDFTCFKYISDGANDNANIDWNTALNIAAHALQDALKRVIK